MDGIIENELNLRSGLNLEIVIRHSVEIFEHDRVNLYRICLVEEQSHCSGGSAATPLPVPAPGQCAEKTGTQKPPRPFLQGNSAQC